MGDIIRGQNLPEGLIIDIGRVDPDDLPRIVSVNGRSYVPSDVVFRSLPPVAIDPDPRWTQETEELLCKAFLAAEMISEGEDPELAVTTWEQATPEDRAAASAIMRPVLAVLADAGLLVQPERP